MSRHDVFLFDLKDAIRNLVTKFPSIDEIYIFGSRAYKTGSYRSDIDLLVYSPSPLHSASLLPYIQTNYSCIDLFESNDKSIAKSIVNGSAIQSALSPVNSKLDAILLWSREEDFVDALDHWEQWILKEANFAASILPIPQNFSQTIDFYHQKLADAGFPDTHLGADWVDIAEKVSSLISDGLDSVSSLPKKDKTAKSFNSSTIMLSNEHDFQNFIYLTLKPWIHSLAPEPFVITYDGQKKNADFSIEDNKLVIEAKHIKDANTESNVIKTLSGLSDFYRTHPNISCLLFLILVDSNVLMDSMRVESSFSKKSSKPSVVVRIIRNNPKATQ